jgi:hypothetical protein
MSRFPCRAAKCNGELPAIRRRDDRAVLDERRGGRAGLRATLGIDRFLGQVDLGGIQRQLVHDSIRRFGEIVAPAVRHVPSN